MLGYMDHTCDRVGTAVGSKSSQLLGSIGTQTRPRKRNNNHYISNTVHCVTQQIQAVLDKSSVDSSKYNK